jgi:hypothetical protein
MAAITTSSMRQWARVGAEQRLLQLTREIAAIHAAFPELRRRTSKTASSSSAPGEGGGKPARRRRRKLSAAARKRISDAQKARWAKQKADKK